MIVLLYTVFFFFLYICDYIINAAARMCRPTGSFFCLQYIITQILLVELTSMPQSNSACRRNNSICLLQCL